LGQGMCFEPISKNEHEIIDIAEYFE
jgi:hypothetical protein